MCPDLLPYERILVEDITELVKNQEEVSAYARTYRTQDWELVQGWELVIKQEEMRAPTRT